MATLAHPLSSRLAQINYDREIALILTDALEPARSGNIFAIVRYAADPDNIRAEYAIIVRQDMGGQGLGRRLMDKLIGYARSRGIGMLYGDVLAENARMLNLCRDLGFRIVRDPETRGLMNTTLSLCA